MIPQAAARVKPQTAHTRRVEDASTRTPIHLPGRRTPIGYVAGDSFFKTIHSGRGHILRVPMPAIGFDLCTLHAAQAAGALWVHIRDADTGDTYRARLADVLAHGIAVNRGYGQQLALPLDRYSINDQAPRCSTVYSTNQERKEAQMDLFGGAA